ncbi:MULTISPECIES: ABC transporter ATP-binding protein [Brevibacillus]|uniref:Phosphonate-transporting ATPase n=2 Tax=Brevibacillus borstelensis TaxID=45462 RepID=M8DCT9_9BACL|nr:ABC transporter ATP-binding protein [Brevibacillus borstelensis]EMT54109.1 phosphonate-transporting ATPase [Brevibacillus borstelensis AK1]MCC0563528.1 ABC transporter ATP-binding protein [Brevibacillus borstelensis]MCM3469663.1 ABC transporter ATP-binding protein [Brevibacillus borstelensis]MCM3557909.1 ABC transporter ATP-binding protein [Brevibacillus borstelensis]MCM3589205.1 ABC transporter ATP-binding protein [Brevibacillus borstelensis]
MLSVNNVRVHYGMAEALRGVNLQVAKGEVVALIGRNGAGKTTLLKAITGLVKLREGEIHFQGKRISGMPAHEIMRLGIGHVPQGRQVFGDQTVEDNLILGAYTKIKQQPRQVREWLEREYTRFPRLKERAKQMAGTLSGGEQQMLALSRALMSDPELLVLDEPSMGLSPLYVKLILDTVTQLRSEGKTILLVEQLAAAALAISDRAYVLSSGQVEMSGAADELLHDEKVVRTYLGA